MFINYTETIEEHTDRPVRTCDADTGEELTTYSISYIYTPINGGLTVKSFNAYAGHPHLESIKAKNKVKFHKQWLVELGFDPLLWHVFGPRNEIQEIGKVQTQEQIDNWLHPNATNRLPPTEAEEI